MDELPYALSEEDFARMSNAVRRVEGLPPRRDSQAIYRAAPEGNAHAWIKVTSATASTVTLGGGTVTGYAAVWGYFDSSATGFTWTTNTAWFVPTPDGSAPVVNQVFECRLLGADTSGVPIWSADSSGAVAWVNVTSSTLSTITLASGTTHGYAATIELYQPSTGTFATGATAWFVSINGETPTVGKNYQCRTLGADTGGVSIWGETIFITPASLLTTQTVTIVGTVTPTTNGAFADVVTLSLVAGKYMLFASASGYVDTGTADNNIQGWARLYDGTSDLTGNYYIAGLTGSASGADWTQRGTASIQIPYTTTGTPTIHLQAQSASPLGTAQLHVQNAVLSSLRIG